MNTERLGEFSDIQVWDEYIMRFSPGDHITYLGIEMTVIHISKFHHATRRDTYIPANMPIIIADYVDANNVIHTHTFGYEYHRYFNKYLNGEQLCTGDIRRQEQG